MARPPSHPVAPPRKPRTPLSIASSTPGSELGATAASALHHIEFPSRGLYHFMRANFDSGHVLPGGIIRPATPVVREEAPLKS